MRFSVTLKKNHEFRRLYTKGKSAATSVAVVYCRKNKRRVNRVGITVSTKIGGAVVRNRIRRRIREIYRLNETNLREGFDIVIVARVKSADCTYQTLQRGIVHLFNKLGITQ